MSVQKVDASVLHKANLGYTIIPNFIFQSIKNIVARAVYTYMMSLPPDWNIQKEHVRKELGLSKHIIDKAFVFLHENYLIEYKRLRDSNGKMTGIKTNVLDGSLYYEKILGGQLDKNSFATKHQEDVTTPPDYHGVVLPQRGQTDPINNIKNKKEIINTNTSSSDDDGLSFDCFWDLWPKKVGKKTAERAWKRLCKKNKKLVMEDIPKRKELCWKEIRYIPNAATYLNGERWDDEYIKFEEKSSLRGSMAVRSEIKSTVPEFKPDGNVKKQRSAKNTQDFKQVMKQLKRQSSITILRK